MPSNKQDVDFATDFEKKIQAEIDARNATRKQQADMSLTHDPIAPNLQKGFGGNQWMPKDPVARKQFMEKYER